MNKADHPRRWPAFSLAVLLLGYAIGKAVYAAQARLGFPGGPPVSAAETERYAREMMNVATAQWLASATGLLATLLVLATVTRVGRRIPRLPMLLMLAALVIGVGAGAATMAVDGFIGLGIGWSRYYGLAGLSALTLLAATIHSYIQATRHGDHQHQPRGVRCRHRTRIRRRKRRGRRHHRDAIEIEFTTDGTEPR